MRFSAPLGCARCGFLLSLLGRGAVPGAQRAEKTVLETRLNESTDEGARLRTTLTKSAPPMPSRHSGGPLRCSRPHA